MSQTNRLLILLVLVALLVSACQPIVAQPLAQPAAQTTEEATNLDVARRYMQELWNEGKLEVYDELIAADFVDLAPRPGFGNDRTAFREDLEGFHRDFPDQMAQFTIDDMVAAGDWVALRGDFVVSPPDAPEPATTEYAVMLRIADGLIRERWGVFNELKLMTGMGFTLTPPEAAASEIVLPEGGAIAQVNDIAMYYEIHGEGEPVLLIHSVAAHMAQFTDVIPLLAKDYQVIAVDFRGHGRTTDSGQPLSYDLIASDMVALLDQLEIDAVHIVGNKDGGITGLVMAMEHPERVKSLVAASVNWSPAGFQTWFVDWLKGVTLDEWDGMVGEMYRTVAPDPSIMALMLEKDRNLLMTQPTFTLEQLGTITAPVLVLAGADEEVIELSHIEEMAAALPNAELVLIDGGGHGVLDEQFAAWMAAVQSFLAVNAEESTVAVAKEAIPRFEPADCNYPVLADTDAECGYLVVREDRANPDSPTIRIHVIKYPSTNATPAPDPIIAVPGGPGASGDFYAWLFGFSPAAEAWRAERDVYGLETRGAMYAEPAFYCPETEADESIFVGMNMAEEVAWTEEAYRACHDRLVDENANLSAYGFLEIASDIADLRTALGLDVVNVYGVSYGTTPAMLVMRDSPDWLRSVVLDSIIPPDVVYLEHVLESLDAALENTFAACRADSACDETYPDLKNVFTNVVSQLRQEPITVTVADDGGNERTVTVDDVKFVHFLYDRIFIGDGFTTVPAGIYAAQNGDLRAPASTWLGYIAGQHGPANAEAGAWAKGMTYAAMCLQDGSVTDLATATAVYDAVDTLPSLRDWGVIHMLGEWLAPCEYWAVTPADPNIATAPVESDIPTLLLGGIFDPEAPPAISVAAAEGLSNSFYYELPAGHGLLFMDCAVDLMTQFLADPTVAPDASCIDTMTPNWLLPE